MILDVAYNENMPIMLDDHPEMVFMQDDERTRTSPGTMSRFEEKGYTLLQCSYIPDMNPHWDGLEAD